MENQPQTTTHTTPDGTEYTISPKDQQNAQVIHDLFELVGKMTKNLGELKKSLDKAKK